VGIMMDDPEIIKILRREEILQKKEEKPHEIFQESELSNNISRCDFEVDIPSKDILSEKTVGIKTTDLDKEWIEDQEFRTRLIEDNNDMTVEKESASLQKA